MSASSSPVMLYQAQDCTHHAVMMNRIAPLTRQLLRVYGMMTMVMYIVKLISESVIRLLKKLGQWQYEEAHLC